MTGTLDRPVRVALDLLGGDHAPGAVISAVRELAASRSELDLVVVGPADLAAESLGDVAGLRIAAANDVVAMGDDASSAVRRKPESTIRVAMDLLAAGDIDAVVSAGSTGATIAAASLALGRTPALSRCVLAAVIPALARPVLVLDVGGALTATPDVLAELAVHGAAHARVRLGVERPSVGLLSVGVEPGKGDALRQVGYDAVAAALADQEADFAGNVEGSDVPLGTVDVVVTDGFTGNVLLKALEGVLLLVTSTIARVAPELEDRVTEAVRPLVPEQQGGALLLGVPGVVVVGHGVSTPAALVSCVDMAVAAVRDDWIARTDSGVLRATSDPLVTPA